MHLHHEESAEFDWWRGVKEGDKEAFSSIYFSHYNSLYQYGVKISGDADMVKDAIHELFLRLWNHRARLGEIHSPRVYLLKAIKRDLIRKLTRGQKQRFLNEADYGVAIGFSPEEVIMQHEDNHEQQALLLRLLNDLPKRQREVLYLKYYENLSHEEIAGMMDMNYQSVSNLLYRALQNLKGSIKSCIFPLLLNILLAK